MGVTMLVHRTSPPSEGGPHLLVSMDAREPGKAKHLKRAEAPEDPGPVLSLGQGSQTTKNPGPELSERSSDSSTGDHPPSFGRGGRTARVCTALALPRHAVPRASGDYTGPRHKERWCYSSRGTQIISPFTERRYSLWRASSSPAASSFGMASSRVMFSLTGRPAR